MMTTMMVDVSESVTNYNETLQDAREDQMNLRNTWNKIQKMWNFQRIHLQIKTLRPVALQHQLQAPNESSMCDEAEEKANTLKTLDAITLSSPCGDTWGISTIVFNWQNLLVWGFSTLGGFLPPKTRSHEQVTDFVAHARNTTHSTEAPRKRTTCRSTFLIFFVAVGHRLHGAAFALLRSVQTESFFSPFCIFFVFLHMLDGHILYMFSWIVLYVSCTKINVAHLSARNHLQAGLKIVYRATNSLDFKLASPWRENTLKYTHTHTD